jgi:hypothetical protein
MGGAASTREPEAMRGNPFATFHRAAEAAGYPALLIVAMVSLGLVVAPVALLGLTRAVWVLALAMLSLALAVAILAAEIEAALGDADAPTSQEDVPTTANVSRDSTALAAEREPEPQHDAPRRRAP